MSYYGLISNVKKVLHPGHTLSLLNTLINLSNDDRDFNGIHGVDCISPKAAKAGFKSNQLYYLSLVKHNIENGMSEANAVANYLDDWLGNDGRYCDYHKHIIEDSNGNVIVVGYAAQILNGR